MQRFPSEGQLRGDLELPSGVPGSITEGEFSDASSSETLPLGSAHDEVSICIDVAFDGYPMATCSIGFTALSGPLEKGSKLLDWVIGPSEFSLWVQSATNALVYGLEPEVPQFM